MFRSLIALLVISAVTAIPVSGNQTNESTTLKPVEDLKNDVTTKQNIVVDVEQGKQFSLQSSKVDEHNENVNPFEFKTKLALDGADHNQALSYIPLNSASGGVLVFPTGALRVIGQAQVSIEESNDDYDNENDYNQLSEEEERAIRRRRRYRKRNNKGSLKRRRRRKGDNEIRRKNYYGSSNSQGKRKRYGSYYDESDGYRRRPQRKRVAYKPSYYYDVDDE